MNGNLIIKSIVLGIAAGWLIKGKEENINKDVQDWMDITDRSGYSESSKFTCDFYFDVGFFYKIESKTVLAFAPFIKYKLKDNWMGEVRCKTCFGLNIRHRIGK